MDSFSWVVSALEFPWSDMEQFDHGRAWIERFDLDCCLACFRGQELRQSFAVLWRLNDIDAAVIGVIAGHPLIGRVWIVLEFEFHIISAGDPDSHLFRKLLGCIDGILLQNDPAIIIIAGKVRIKIRTATIAADGAVMVMMIPRRMAAGIT